MQVPSPHAEPGTPDSTGDATDLPSSEDPAGERPGTSGPADASTVPVAGAPATPTVSSASALGFNSCRGLSQDDGGGLKSTSAGEGGATAFLRGVRGLGPSTAAGPTDTSAASSWPADPSHPLSHPWLPIPLAPPVPAGPTSGSAITTSACGSGNGNGTRSGTDLAVLATEHAVYAAHASARAETRAAGRVFGRPDDPGSRPG